jgi:hypothetical protein
MFNNPCRIGDDLCSIDQRTIQNVEWGNYTLTNYLKPDANSSELRKMATTQPGLNYTAYDIGGYAVPASSELSLGQVQAGAGSRKIILTRPYMTVPFLGRMTTTPGSAMSVAELETSIQRSDPINRRKASAPPAQANAYRSVPLIPECKQALQTRYMIEQDAAGDWVRGGIADRMSGRDASCAGNFHSEKHM